MSVHLVVLVITIRYQNGIIFLYFLINHKASKKYMITFIYPPLMYPLYGILSSACAFCYNMSIFIVIILYNFQRIQYILQGVHKTNIWFVHFSLSLKHVCAHVKNHVMHELQHFNMVKYFKVRKFTYTSTYKYWTATNWLLHRTLYN